MNHVALHLVRSKYLPQKGSPVVSELKHSIKNQCAIPTPHLSQETQVETLNSISAQFIFSPPLCLCHAESTIVVPNTPRNQIMNRVTAIVVQTSLHHFFLSAFSFAASRSVSSFPYQEPYQSVVFPNSLRIILRLGEGRGLTFIGVVAKCLSIASIRSMSRIKISSRLAFASSSSLESSEGAQRLIPPSSVPLSDIDVCGLVGMGAWRWLCGMSVVAVSSFLWGRT